MRQRDKETRKEERDRGTYSPIIKFLTEPIGSDVQMTVPVSQMTVSDYPLDQSLALFLDYLDNDYLSITVTKTSEIV